jgi:hypothetical protein
VEDAYQKKKRNEETILKVQIYLKALEAKETRDTNNNEA